MDIPQFLMECSGLKLNKVVVGNLRRLMLRNQPSWLSGNLLLV
jgi:hypothetical protein